MQKYIKIESKGLIDPQAFVLLGASTKRDDHSKIGFFGSGLKYSIAYLLRNNIKFKVFSEYKEVTFKTKETNFRDKSFSVIVINDKETSMTTEMGIDWEPWFIIREIFCNAIDEGEANIDIVYEYQCKPIEDKTVFYIEITENLKEVIDNWNSYFAEKRPDLISYTDNIHFYTGGDELVVYRKGVRCYQTSKTKCIFNYDVDWVNINESRVIKSDFDFKWQLATDLKKLNDKKIIKKILKDINETWETQLFWDTGTSNYSNEWLICINKKILVPYENAGFWSDEINLQPSRYLILPSKMVNGLKQRFNNDVKIVGETEDGSTSGMKIITELSPKQNALLKDSIEFLKCGNYVIEYEIVVVKFALQERLGLAKDNKIFLSEKLFEKGRKEIVATIIEENEHLITNYADETRSFQNHFIMKYISEMENRIQKYL